MNFYFSCMRQLGKSMMNIVTYLNVINATQDQNIISKYEPFPICNNHYFNKTWMYIYIGLLYYNNMVVGKVLLSGHIFISFCSSQLPKYLYRLSKLYVCMGVCISASGMLYSSVFCQIIF